MSIRFWTFCQKSKLLLDMVQMLTADKLWNDVAFDLLASYQEIIGGWLEESQKQKE